MRCLFLKLKRLKSSLRDFNKVHSGDISRKVQQKRAELKSQQLLSLSVDCPVEVHQKVEALSAELRVLQEAEASFYRQKAKIQWLIEGHQSTRFFHQLSLFDRTSLPFGLYGMRKATSLLPLLNCLMRLWVISRACWVRLILLFPALINFCLNFCNNLCPIMCSRNLSNLLLMKKLKFFLVRGMTNPLALMALQLGFISLHGVLLGRMFLQQFVIFFTPLKCSLLLIPLPLPLFPNEFSLPSSSHLGQFRAAIQFIKAYLRFWLIDSLFFA
ncbi:hypothetical protein J1N35_033580 [Gossypium stocksii]|uniref:Uncharacterized protein n=1 Tax=Gossypium stocksii TaxID=47602 RepID=A0A9D3UQF6_9ROSI|nr:hypothetical protein J1N35_033580 [Gossypium stocksii]